MHHPARGPMPGSSMRRVPFMGWCRMAWRRSVRAAAAVAAAGCAVQASARRVPFVSRALFALAIAGSPVMAMTRISGPARAKAEPKAAWLPSLPRPFQATRSHARCGERRHPDRWLLIHVADSPKVSALRSMAGSAGRGRDAANPALDLAPAGHTLPKASLGPHHRLAHPDEWIRQVRGSRHRFRVGDWGELVLERGLLLAKMEQFQVPRFRESKRLT